MAMAASEQVNVSVDTHFTPRSLWLREGQGGGGQRAPRGRGGGRALALVPLHRDGRQEEPLRQHNPRPLPHHGGQEGGREGDGCSGLRLHQVSGPHEAGIFWWVRWDIDHARIFTNLNYTICYN